jgi:multidrug efflux pump subunit AcrA (membrane-fusion protein)
VERLREYFSKCGATVGAGGLTALISARAVEAAPAGLASAICIGALPGGAASLSAAFAGTKGMMMTGLNKILIAAVLTGTVGSIIYGIRQAQLRQRDMQRMAQDRTAITEAIQRLQQERDQATNELAALREQGQAANRNKAELLRLRGMVTLLRNELGSLTNRAAAAESRADLSEHHLPWKLREARKFEEFQNVGNQTPEAAAETVLWAAYNQDTNVLSMVYLPEDAAAKADEMGRLDTLQTRLRAQILTTVLAVGSKSREVWLDGGQETVFRAVQGNTTNTYAGVIDFRLTARANPEDPATERHTDILFARVDGMWKMVIPGISPPIPEAVR